MRSERIAFFAVWFLGWPAVWPSASIFSAPPRGTGAALHATGGHQPQLPAQSPADPRTAIRNFILSGDQALHSSQLERAESDYREALGIVLKQLGEGLLLLHDLADSGEAYGQASRILGLQEELWMSQAIETYMTGNDTAAAQALENVIQVNSLNPLAHYLRANAAYRQGRKSDALQHLTRVLHNQPWNLSAALLASRISLQLDQVDDARKWLGSVKAQLDSPALKEAVEKSLEGLQPIQKEIREPQESSSADPHNRGADSTGATGLHNLSAEALSGEISAPPILNEETEEKLQEMTEEFRQQSVQLLLTLSRVLTGQGRHAEAAELFRMALHWSGR